MSVITLLTDFGTQDGYAGVMRGVIWKINPQIQIADLTHEISPQNIREGALTLARCAPFFPENTVHIAVVDPGVGSQRRPIAAQLGSHYFVGPDNGLFTLLLENAEVSHSPFTIVHLDQPGFWLTPISYSFHGRDIFAPVGAHLASGVPLLSLGSPINDPIRISFPKPRQITNGWQGEIIAIDHFGNLSTNLERSLLSPHQQIQVYIKKKMIHNMVKSYSECRPGDLVAIFDSDHRLSIAVVNGNASLVLQAQVGDQIELQVF